MSAIGRARQIGRTEDGSHNRMENPHRSRAEAQRLQSAIQLWLEERTADFRDPLFVTLLFRDRLIGEAGDVLWLEKDVASTEIKRLGNRLDRAVYGRAVQRFNRRVRRVPVLEYGAADRGWHCHMLVETPDGMLEVRFRHIIRTAWSKSPWAADFHARAGDAGAIDYLTKERSKERLEVWSDTIVAAATVLTTK
jgi:hypothetical protein